LCKNNEFSFSSKAVDEGENEKRPEAANNKSVCFQKALISEKFATRARSRARAKLFFNFNFSSTQFSVSAVISRKNERFLFQF
jgi:hypothetical protein